MGYILELYALDHANFRAAIDEVLSSSGGLSPEQRSEALGAAASAQASAGEVATGDVLVVLTGEAAAAVRSIIRRIGVPIGDLTHSSAATPQFVAFLGDPALSVDGIPLWDRLIGGPVGGFQGPPESDETFGGIPQAALEPIMTALDTRDPDLPDDTGWNGTLWNALDDCLAISQMDLVAIYG